MCNSRLFWGSKEIGSCQSVDLSLLLWFLGSKIGSLELVVAGCFFLRVALGYENVELSSLLGF